MQTEKMPCTAPRVLGRATLHRAAEGGSSTGHFCRPFPESSVLTTTEPSEERLDRRATSQGTGTRPSFLLIHLPRGSQQASGKGKQNWGCQAKALQGGTTGQESGEMTGSGNCTEINSALRLGLQAMCHAEESVRVFTGPAQRAPPPDPTRTAEPIGRCFRN